MDTGFTFSQSLFFLKNILFIFWLRWVFVATHGLFSGCGEWGLLLVAMHRLLIAVTSVVAEHGLQARGLQQLWHTGSVVVACGLQSAGSVVVVHRLSCSAACGIFLDQDSNPRPLHWQADSQPLRHHGSPPQSLSILLKYVFPLKILLFNSY